MSNLPKRAPAVAASPAETLLPMPGDLARSYLPLKISLAVAGGTYLLFLIGPSAAQSPNVPLTTAFMIAVVGSLGVGYRLSVIRRRDYPPVAAAAQDRIAVRRAGPC